MRYFFWMMKEVRWFFGGGIVKLFFISDKGSGAAIAVFIET